MRQPVAHPGSPLRLRERGGGLRAVFQLEPERAEETLARELGAADLHCTRLGLEEMFVELAGGQW